MNRHVPPISKEQINAFCSKSLENPIEDGSFQSYQALLSRWQDFHRSYMESTAAILQRWAERYKLATTETNILNKIEAESIVVEVIDQNTGKLFRRTLPISYLENSNGLILSGETMEGNPSQIAFLSETALNRINDLRGKGPDSPRCKD